jgi:GTPase SAR1 family protein
VTCEKSFDNIRQWIRNIETHASEDVEKMILGNKCDMDEKRAVSKERGDALALEYGIPFLETSAKNNINVEQAFTQMAAAIKKKMDSKASVAAAKTTGIQVSNAPSKRSAFANWCTLL